MIDFRKLRLCIWANLRSIIISKNFGLSVVLMFVILFAEVASDAFTTPWRQMDQTGYGDAYFFNISIHFGYYIYAAPLLCAFAASWLFCDDADTGYYRSRLMKSGKREYQYGLFLGTTLGGGLALMIGILLFATSLAVIYPPYYPATGMAVMNAWIPVLQGPIGNWNYMICNALLAFIFGMIWSGIGLIFSVLSHNRYISYLSPFIICLSLVLVMPVELQPLEMLVQMNWNGFTFPEILVYQSILYIGVMVLFIVAFERRVIRERY